MYYVLSLSPLTVLSTSFFPACYPLFWAPVVLVFVYTCVYSCVPTCTLLYTRVYTEAIITTSSRGSPQCDKWACFILVGGLYSGLSEGFAQRHPRTSINNVPAYEDRGNLRCDLELWGEMHYLCRRKSKRGGAQQARRTRREKRSEGRGVCEKICGKIW